MKKYNEMMNVGKAKYLVSFYNGMDTHKDGSEFWGIRTFTNKVDKGKFCNTLLKEGYIYSNNIK